MDATGNYGMTDCKVFVGGLPFDADRDAVYEALGAWEGVVQIFYKGSGGWATAEFTSKQRRDEFVRNKDRYNKILNVKVDIKEFSDKSKSGGHANANANANSNSNPAPVSPVKAPAQPSVLDNRNGVQNGSIMEYVYGKKAVFGVIRPRPPNEANKVVFHAASVYYCDTHKLMCSSSACPGYQFVARSLNRQGLKLCEVLPPGTQVNFLQRAITFREVPFALQATVVWPSLSKRPRFDLDEAELNLHLLLLDYISAPSSQQKSSDVSFSSGPKPFANVKETTPPFSRPQEQDLSGGAAAYCDSEAMATASSSSIHSQQSVVSKSDRDVKVLLQIFDELKHFLESHIRPLGVNKSLAALAKKLLTIAASNLERANASASGVLIMMKFLKDQGVQPAKQKDLLTSYKSYHEAMAQRLKRDVEDIDMVERALEEGARKVGAAEAKTVGATGEEGDTDRSKKTEAGAGVSSDGSGDGPERMDGKDRAVSARCPKFLIPSGNIVLPCNLSLHVGGFSSPEGFFDTVQVGNDHLNQQMAKWLKEELFPAWRARSVYPFAVQDLAKSVLKTWMDSTRPPLKLKEELRNSLDKPSSLLASWSSVAEKAWASANADHPRVAVDFVVRCSILHCWDHLSKNSIPVANDDSKFRRLLTDAPYKSDGGAIFNLRGVVARHFGQSVGIAFTSEGAVFFGGHVAYIPNSKSGGKKWTCCSGELRSQLAVGTVVRLHATVTKAPSEKYLYATKVWAPTLPHTDHDEEPVIGPEVPGGEHYWKQLSVEIEKVLRANPTFGLTSEGADASCQFSKRYDEAVEHFLNARYDVSKRRLGADAEDDSTKAKVALSYGNFLNFCASAGLGFSKGELIDSLKVLQSVDGLGFFDLRKRFVACSVTNTVPLFQEEVELAMMTSAASVLTVADSPRLVNVSPILVRFFDEADPVAEGQVQEIRKCLEHKTQGSLQYAQELYDKVSSSQFHDYFSH